jgi:tetratricopeptide (TPR) repeat protein
MARRLGDPWTLVLTNNITGQSSATAEELTAAYERVFAICRAQDVYPYRQFMGDALRLYGDRLRGFGHFAEAEAQYREALALFRSFDDVYLIAYPLGSLGRMALLKGNLSEAEALIGESVAFTRRGGSRVAIADWLFRLGLVHLYQGDLAAAEGDLYEAVTLYEEVGSGRGAADVTAALAEVALERGDREQAARYIQDCFSFYRGLLASLTGDFLEDYGFDTAEDLLANMLRAGLVMTADEEWENAALLFAAVASIQARLNYRAVRPLQEKVNRAREGISQHLPDAPLKSVQEQGQALTVQQAVNLILS